MEIITKNSGSQKSKSICQEFNLNTNDLVVQTLMDKTIYRRLYNVVCSEFNHDLNNTSYRKNLIKQLYFLLKIVPVMKSDLQDKFLENLQKWYNMNDHKKTQLASGGLRKIINQFSKQPSGHTEFLKERPKSGVSWNKNVHPFLRPYTAKKTYNQQFKRPQSSNYGQNSLKNGKSTNISTKLDSCEQLTMRQFTSSIQQQLQISQDFLQKHRTIHPQSQPIYEQLYNILKKVHHGHLQQMQAQSQNQMLFNFDKEDFFENIICQQEKPKAEKKATYIQEIQENVNEFDKASQESLKQEENSQLDDRFQKKLYQTDKRDKKDLNVDQFHFFKPQSNNQFLLLKKVNNKYTHFTNNRIVNQAKDDQQIVRKYVNYTRAKSAIKRELNRKSQTKKILSAKGSRSNTRIFLQQKTNRPVQKFGDRSNQLQRRNSIDKVRSFDLSQLPNDFQTKENIPLPKYNKRQFLNQLYVKQIKNYKKSNGCISTAEIKQVRKFPLTKFQSFLSQERIDPLSEFYKQKHNQQALDEMQKIKMKIHGKSSVSTDALMKALYIDNSIYSINNDIGSSQNAWQGRDLCYGLLSNGAKKKLKRKNRKLKKPK